MSSYKGKDFFGSGAHRFTVHGRSLRYAVREAAGHDGVQVAAQGRSGRRISQVGALLADNTAEMQTQLDAIESSMDGVAGELVDDRGRVFTGVLMVAFDPGRIQRAGARLRVDYQIEYLQGQP